jgi:hypothetical protein
MYVDKKNVLVANLLDQWTDLSLSDKQEYFFDTVGTTAFFGLLGNSARCAGKGNWPAAFYNLALAGGTAALLISAA